MSLHPLKQSDILIACINHGYSEKWRYGLYNLCVEREGNGVHR